MGLLSLMMVPAEAAAILIVPSFITNVWQALGSSFIRILRRLWAMMLGICVGTYAAAGLLTGDTSGRAALGLGIALILYAITGLIGFRVAVPVRHEPWLSPLIGTATGIVTGATGVFVIPAVPYLQALGFEKDELVQALGISFLVSTVALGLALMSGGAFGRSIAMASVLALAPALAGMAIGQIVRSRISTALFRQCFFWGLLALGAHLALRNIM